MKTILILIVATIVGIGGYLVFNGDKNDSTPAQENVSEQAEENTNVADTTTEPVTVTPIAHATMVLTMGDAVVYADPVGDKEAFMGQPPADIILITDIHGDHLSTSTLEIVMGSSTILVVPQAVKDVLPTALAERAKVIANDETITELGVAITGVPMYNMPEAADSRHVKGRGNGYVLTHKDTRVYIAGDTGPTPEMKALRDIDIAFVPMNLPYTMSVEEAATAVLAFAPKKVYPYHYRQPDGFADVKKFSDLVHTGNPAIEVELLEWYPK